MLSNASLDSAWPKAARGREAFVATLAAGADAPPADLARALADRVLADETRVAPAEGTGLPRDHERRFAFVSVPATDFGGGQLYGTRTRTVACVGRDGSTFVLERDLDASSGCWSDVEWRGG